MLASFYGRFFDLRMIPPESSPIRELLVEYQQTSN